MARKRINSKNHTKEKPYLINSHFFFKLVRQKNSIGWEKYMCVCEWDMCWKNFCNFSLVTKKNVKSRSKLALFPNEGPFEIWFPEKKTITFFWSKYLNYTHTHTPTHPHTPTHQKKKKKKKGIACDNYIFPNTRGIKKKQWTHSSPVNQILYVFFVVVVL